jgi:hypothetical protein
MRNARSQWLVAGSFTSGSRTLKLRARPRSGRRGRPAPRLGLLAVRQLKPRPRREIVEDRREPVRMHVPSPLTVVGGLR